METPTSAPNTTTNETTTPNPEDASNERLLAETAAFAAWDRKAHDIRVLDVRSLVSYTDFFVVCSGTSDRQVKSIADFIQAELTALGFQPRGVEGASFGHWVVLDYGDIIVHIFHDEERDLYGLERLWSDAPRIEIDFENAEG